MKTLRIAILTHGFRTMKVQIGKRVYEVERLTESSQRRLLAVLNAVPAENRCVELDSDLTPTVYFHFYKTAKPTRDTARREELMSTAVSDFTETDRADWLRIFGWAMPVRKPAKVETVTRLPECMTYRALEMAWW